MPKSSPSKNKTGKVIWCDRSFQLPGIFYAFVPDEKAWHRELKRLGLPDEPYPTSAGRCSSYNYDGKLVILVTLGTAHDKKDKICALGLLAHESMHAWRFIREHINETEPSLEFEAYMLQSIFQSLVQAWMDTRNVKL